MKAWFSKNWASQIVPALVILVLVACGGKKGGGEATNADVQANIEKVSTAGSGSDSDLGVKDSGTGNENDICDRQGDAYARFASYANQSRDYVYKVAKESGFDALYTARPATYTAADVAVMYTTFAQADPAAFGLLNAKIEIAYAKLQGVVEKGEWKYVFNEELLTMLQARKSLFTFYANIFGMNAYTWIENRTLDGQIADSQKKYLDYVENNAELEAARKVEIEHYIIETARLSAMRFENTKDYFIHAVFDNEKLIKIELVPAQQGFNYLGYRQYTKDEYAQMKTRLEDYSAKIDQISAEYEKAIQDNKIQPTEIASVTATFQRQYAEYTASRQLVLTFYRFLSANFGVIEIRDNAEKAKEYIDDMRQQGDNLLKK
ncbi:MAG: hypothetical protein IT572_11060 [Deltaproteobacteria bacterium]|nr:hypothetical protein [Deltaproteobacteria bacterium]